MLEDLKLTSGRVALYGKDEIGPLFAILTRLQELLPGIQLVGFAQDEILLNAMMTKDAQEVEQIREMGRITTDVVGKTADYLTGQRVANGVLVHADDSPVTLGEVKNLLICGWQSAGWKTRKGPFFPSGGMQASTFGWQPF